MSNYKDVFIPGNANQDDQALTGVSYRSPQAPHDEGGGGPESADGPSIFPFQRLESGPAPAYYRTPQNPHENPTESYRSPQNPHQIDAAFRSPQNPHQVFAQNFRAPQQPHDPDDGGNNNAEPGIFPFERLQAPN